MPFLGDWKNDLSKCSFYVQCAHRHRVNGIGVRKSIDCAKEALRVTNIELNMIMIHEDEAGMAFENGSSGVRQSK